jgi:protease PrsW
MDLVNLILLAIIPPIGILYLTTKFDKKNKSKDNIWFAFFIGLIIAAPIGYVGDYVAKNNIILDPLIQAFVMAALLEESFKFFSFKFFFFDKNKIFEPLDCLLFAGAISLGFAATENLLYVISMGVLQEGIAGGYWVAFLRMFTAIPAHATFGIVMGYLASTYKFGNKNQTDFILYVLGIPVLLHGFYNFFQMSDSFSLIYSFILLILSVLFSYRALKKLKTNSPDEILNFDKDYNSVLSFFSNKGEGFVLKIIIYICFVVLLLLTWLFVLNLELFQSGLNPHILFIFLFPLLFVYDIDNNLLKYYMMDSSIKNQSISYLNNGNSLYRSKKFKDALENYSNAIKINPFFDVAYKNRALAKKSLGDYAGQKNDYDKYEKMLGQKYSLENLINSLIIYGAIVIVLSLLTAFFDINIFNGCNTATKGKYGAYCKIRDFLSNL